MSKFDSLPKEEQEEIIKNYETGQHVYFVKAKKVNMVKIGIAKEPAWRVKDLQVGSPVELKLLFVIPYGGRLIEKRLHEQFEHLHVRGEWFKYDTEIREIIKKIKVPIREVKWTRFANKLQRG